MVISHLKWITACTALWSIDVCQKKIASAEGLCAGESLNILNTEREIAKRGITWGSDLLYN